MRRRIAGVFLFLLIGTGCSGDETEVVKGIVHQINADHSFVLYVGDSLSEGERITGNFDREEELTFVVEVDEDTDLQGEVTDFNHFQLNQKVEVTLSKNYKREYATVHTLFKEHGKMNSYTPEEITTKRYTEDDLVEEMKASSGNYALYIYDTTSKEPGGSIDDYLGGLNSKETFSRVNVRFDVSKVKNEEELLGVHKNDVTYVVLNHEEVVLQTTELEELQSFVESVSES